MKLVLGLLLVLLALAVLAGVYTYWRLKRLAESPESGELLESFDEGLAIPMRDGDTRRPRKEQP